MTDDQQELWADGRAELDAALEVGPGITVTGSREISRGLAREHFGKHLTPWLGAARTWLIGGALGVDTWAIEWLGEHGEDCWAVVPFSASEQPKGARAVLGSVQVVELNLPRGKSSYLKRNRYMVERSQVVIGFWTGKKGGSLSTLEFGLRQGLEVHAYPVLDSSGS